MIKFLSVLGLLMLLTFRLLVDAYKRQKDEEHGDTFQWQSVKIKTNSIILTFYQAIFSLIAVACILTDLFIGKGVLISLDKTLWYSFFFLLFRYPLEYFALRFYEHKSMPPVNSYRR
ncbi:hypothetical protein [Enterococcus sp. CSURQ0835]|uniref:hypothetical protein n=1 Tax=Enterococcus sp. CSURQ0835 TaxID=2681394 RepID=UPI00135B2920|nr:hypothetical protein [Enterococcus sp. CSURQ0835]